LDAYAALKGRSSTVVRAAVVRAVAVRAVAVRAAVVRVPGSAGDGVLATVVRRDAGRGAYGRPVFQRCTGGRDASTARKDGFAVLLAALSMDTRGGF